MNINHESYKKEMEEKNFLNNLNKNFFIWLKKPYNFALFLLLIFLIIFRFYFFFQTLDQPLWWDEANYMNIARTWLGAEYWKEQYWKIDVIRPVLFPLIIAGFLVIGLGESAVRFFVLLCSIVSVLLIYCIGKLFFNKRVGLMAAFILAVFWSFSFYSYRLLVDIPVAALWLATIYLFFYAYFKNKNLRYFIFAGFFLGLSFLMKFSSVVLVFIIFIYLLTTEKLKIFNKKIITFYLTSLLTVMPYFFWQWFSFGSPFAFYFKATTTRAHFRSFLESLFDQIFFSLKLIQWIFLVFFIMGLFVILGYVFLLPRKISVKKSNSNKNYFILLWIVLSLLFFGWVGYGTYMEERYYFVFYPAVFLVSAIGLNSFYKWSKKYYKPLAIFSVIAILIFGGYQDIKHANQIINFKKSSFEQLKLAGLWIRENTEPDDSILLLEEQAEVSYYAERKFYLINRDNSTDILNKIKKYNPRYVVLSFYYSLGNDFSYNAINFILSNSSIFRLVKSYEPYVNEEKTLPLVMIFEINY